MRFDRISLPERDSADCTYYEVTMSSAAVAERKPDTKPADAPEEAPAPKGIPGLIVFQDAAALLPHQPPFRFIDFYSSPRPMELDAYYAVPVEPIWAAAHFPGDPIQPGVLVTEASAQALAIYAMAYGDTPPDHYPMLRAAEDWKYRYPVFPGDILYFQIRGIVKAKQGLWFANEVTVFKLIDGESDILVAKGIVKGGTMSRDDLRKMKRRRKG